MIREEFEDLNAPRRKTLRTVEPYSLQEENEKLIRQNRELEKSVERLDFFNKLLEKEIVELKNPDGIITGRKSRKNEPFTIKRKSRGVSNFAFFGLFLFTLTLAAFTVYSLFFVNADYPFLRRLKGQIPATIAVEIAPPVNNNTTPVIDEQRSLDKNAETSKKNEAPVKDQKKNETSAAINSTSSKNFLKQKEKIPAENLAANSVTSASANPVKQVNNEQNNNSGGNNSQAVGGVTESAQPKSGGTSIPETSAPAVGNITPSNTPAETENEKKSFGAYKVISKANFYTAPNENALNGQFIYQFSPVTLDALDETKDFILVVTKSNMGMNTKGWLSKKDLRRIDQ